MEEKLKKRPQSTYGPRGWRSAEFGDGLEYITQKKLGQLEFAAAEWVSSNSWDGDYQIDAIAVTGNAIDGWKFDYRPNIIF